MTNNIYVFDVSNRPGTYIFLKQYAFSDFLSDSFLRIIIKRPETFDN